MSQEVLNYVIEKTRELIAAPTCSSETKAAAQKWLDAVGTDAEKEETEKYIAELEADIMPIDMLIGFAGSEKGSDYFGAETAAAIVAHAKEIKAAGAKYCDCPACSIVEEILKKKAEILKQEYPLSRLSVTCRWRLFPCVGTIGLKCTEVQQKKNQ